MSLMSRQAARAKYILIGGFVLLWASLQLRGLYEHRQLTEANTQSLARLRPDSIRFITLYPFPKTRSLVNDPVVLHDRHAIATLVGAYHRLRPYRAGDGRLDGNWQVTVVFTTTRRQEITSDLYHTDYADLVFLPTPDQPEPHGLDDLYASHELSTLLLQALKPK